MSEINSHPTRILLVEDNPGDARLLRESLMEVGSFRFDLTHVSTLSAGLERLAESVIDVVLLDLSLPDSLGLDSFIQVHAQAPGVPFVVLTGLADETLAIAAVREGAQDYLVKGQVDRELLVRSIHYAIERKRSDQALLQKTREVAVLEERARLAREIHDTLAQGFTGIVLQLESAELALRKKPRQAAARISVAKNLATESLQEARRSVWDKVPQALEQRSLEAALELEVRKPEAAGPEKASFTPFGEKRELPSDVETALLRICQESLTNLHKYAKATEVKVTLAYQIGQVVLTVQDNGIGFDPHVSAGRRQDGGGFGLVSMRERASLLGGELIVETCPGQGTLVKATLPLK